MNKLAILGSDIASLWAGNSTAYLNGMMNTIILAVIATVVGCIIGLFCGILQTIPSAKTDNIFKRIFLWILRALIRIYVEVFRGTPMILQAVFIYFGLPYFTDNAVRFGNPWIAALVVVSINTGAYMAETVRGGILSVDPGQTEGAKAIGMTHFQTMVGVVLPQALRNIMPQIGNNLIINIKDTAVMFVISFTEFFAVHRAVAGLTFKYFPSATIEMAGYLTMTVVCSILLRWLENKMDGDDSFNLATTDTLAHTSGMTRYRAVKNANMADSRKKAGTSDIGNLNLDQNERGR